MLNGSKGASLMANAAVLILYLVNQDVIRMELVQGPPVVNFGPRHQRRRDPAAAPPRGARLVNAGKRGDSGPRRHCLAAWAALVSAQRSGLMPWSKMGIRRRSGRLGRIRVALEMEGRGAAAGACRQKWGEVARFFW